MQKLVLSVWVCLLGLMTAAQDFPTDFFEVNDLAEDSSLVRLNYNDQGAWFSMGYPLEKSDTAGFLGPWLTPSLTNKLPVPHFGGLVLKDSLGNVMSLSEANWSHEQFPHKLEQNIEAELFDLKSELTWSDDARAIVKYTLSNKSPGAIFFDLDLVGESLDTNLTFQKDAGGVFMNVREYRFKVKMCNTKHYFKNTQLNNTHFSHDLAQLTLEPGESGSWLMSLDLLFYGESHERPNFEALETLIDENQMRWQKMLAPYVHKFKDQPEMIDLAAKSLMTLMVNWKRAAGELQHAGLFPSQHQQWFHGFWSWDSWKHAAALASINPELAKDQVRAMFDFQNEDGMVADCVYRDSQVEAHNWANTKPPLATWAVKEIYDQTGDDGFVWEMMPSLLAYHSWWNKRRNSKISPYFAYGSQNSSKKAALWESGMDNAVRFDYSGYAVHYGRLDGMLDLKNVDLNAYLYHEEFLLETLIKDAGLSDEFSVEPLFEANPVKAFWSDAEQCFFDFREHEKMSASFVKVMGTECWTPLFTSTASNQQAKAIREIILDENKFNTFVPFPTVSADNPKFAPEDGYWRGPVWFDQAYFAIRGLRNYGYEQDANELTLKLLQNAEGVLGSDAPLRENYQPLTGDGLNAEHFSWTAACILLMLDELTLDSQE